MGFTSYLFTCNEIPDASNPNDDAYNLLYHKYDNRIGYKWVGGSQMGFSWIDAVLTCISNPRIVSMNHERNVVYGVLGDYSAGFNVLEKLLSNFYKWDKFEKFSYKVTDSRWVKKGGLFGIGSRSEYQEDVEKNEKNHKLVIRDIKKFLLDLKKARNKYVCYIDNDTDNSDSLQRYLIPRCQRWINTFVGPLLNNKEAYLKCDFDLSSTKFNDSPVYLSPDFALGPAVIPYIYEGHTMTIPISVLFERRSLNEIFDKLKLRARRKRLTRATNEYIRTNDLDPGDVDDEEKIKEFRKKFLAGEVN